jgi:hypothetical protein
LNTDETLAPLGLSRVNTATLARPDRELFLKLFWVLRGSASRCFRCSQLGALPDRIWLRPRASRLRRTERFSSTTCDRLPGAAVRTVAASGQHATLASWRAVARSRRDQSALGPAATWERHHQALHTGGTPLLNSTHAPSLPLFALRRTRALATCASRCVGASQRHRLLLAFRFGLLPFAGPVGFQTRRLRATAPPRADTRKFPGF